MGRKTYNGGSTVIRLGIACVSRSKTEPGPGLKKPSKLIGTQPKPKGAEIEWERKQTADDAARLERAIEKSAERLKTKNAARRQWLSKQLHAKPATDAQQTKPGKWKRRRKS